MTINEKAAYIKGLADGLSLDEKKPEVRVIKEMISLLSDIADYITVNEEELDGICDVVDGLSDELSGLEEEFDDLSDYVYDTDEFEDEYEDEDNPDYEVKCPDCGAEIVVDEDTLLEGEINCPNCGNELEFDFTSLFADEVCDCGDSDCPVCNPDEEIPF